MSPLGERDPVSGRRTTGHEWDGLKELDTPVPRAAKWAMRLTILFTVGYSLYYPAWPYGGDYTRGALDYSSRREVAEKAAAARESRAPLAARLLSAEPDALAASPEARAALEPAGAVLFRENCAVCHRRDGGGQTGFPDLTDDHWLWDGSLEEIELTIRHGVNWPADEDARASAMPPFGTDGVLEPAEIDSLVDHLRRISGAEEAGADDVGAGAALFADYCAACHGEEGEGGLGLGAPSLTDAAWIYGGDRQSLTETIAKGRIGVMPAWRGRLGDAEIRQLALYVRWLGDGEDSAAEARR